MACFFMLAGLTVEITIYCDGKITGCFVDENYCQIHAQAQEYFNELTLWASKH